MEKRQNKTGGGILKRYGVWFETESQTEAQGVRVCNDTVCRADGDFSVRMEFAPGGRLIYRTVRPVLMDASGLTITACADKPIVLSVAVAGTTREIRLDSDFQTYSLGFSAQVLESITFSCGVSGGTVYIDSMEAGGQGIIKKSLEQIKWESRETLEQRRTEAFRRNLQEGAEGFHRIYDRLWLEEDLQACGELIAYCREQQAAIEAGDDPIWTPIDAHMGAMNLYFSFGKHGKHRSGRLTAEAEHALLEYLWTACADCNDIHLAKTNTWYVHSSENHDLGLKTACLLSSMIFKNEPEFRDRRYPDTGCGFGAKRSSGAAQGETAEAHYAAWVSFFLEYFSERAKKGFFIERASPHYMKWTLADLIAIVTHVEDTQLQKTAEQFLHLVWADWVQEQICGMRGGVKTRHHYTAGENGEDAMRRIAEFLLGRELTAALSYRTIVLGDYRLPDSIMRMALDRRAMGRFTYLSRGITEENPVLPRPSWAGRTMLADTESRCVRVSYVTPDYILSSQLDHPHSNFNHLAVAGRWMGLVTADCRARVVPVALEPSSRLSPNGERYSMDVVCAAVQHKNVVIFQQKRRLMQINPQLFPAYDDLYNQKLGILIGDGWEERRLQDGVLFLRRQAAYAAIRVLLFQTDTDPLAWAKGTGAYHDALALEKEPFVMEENDTVLRLKSPFSPVILEAGSLAEHGSFQAFCEAVAGNHPICKPTIVTREAGAILSYRGTLPDAETLTFNGANNDDLPTIGGKAVDYQHPMTFDSPYLQSAYGSGEIIIAFDAEQLRLSF